MADEGLIGEIFDRLEASGQPNRVVDLVLAAMEGEDRLAAALGGVAVPRPKQLAEPSEIEPVEGAYLTSITVRSFRGIGPESVLELHPGPGLTVVHGGNGSGKSSFAEGLEIALTGDAHRFNRGGKVWRDGWRNLHGTDAPRVAVGITLPGHRGTCVIERSWSSDDLLASSTAVRRPGLPTVAIDELGWTQVLGAMRPICASAEIESLIEQTPVELYRRLSTILGLDDIAAAIRLLKEHLAPINERVKARDESKKTARAALESVDDTRARNAVALIRKRPVPLAELSVLVETTAAADPALADLEAIAAIAAPDLDAVSAVGADLRRTADELLRLDTPQARQARATVAVLDAALAWHDHTGDADCPVCGTSAVLNDTWRESTNRLVGELRDAANALTSAEGAFSAAVSTARRQCLAPIIPEPGIDSVAAADLSRCWAEWSGTIPSAASADDADETATRFEEASLAVAELHGRVVAAARAEIEERESRWRDAAAIVRDYIALARATASSEGDAEMLDVSRRWLEETEQTMRNDRLADVRVRARAYWDQLRQQSSIELSDYSFTGKGNHQRVSFDVVVDGVKSQALGVMSQGELNALALSIFLPRATQPESPFRFCVIDDPVQAMDPAKVGGLARVLSELAVERQVVVFTHDLRLVDALEHLGIPATVLEVIRSEGSNVEIRQLSDPVSRFLDDASAIISDPEVPDDVIRRVVPNLCRQAVEEALARRYRRQQLARGEDHDSIESALRACDGANPLAALALCGAKERGGDVLTTLNQKFGRRAANAFVIIKRDGHKGTATAGDACALIDPTRRLCGELTR